MTSGCASVNRTTNPFLPRLGLGLEERLLWTLLTSAAAGHRRAAFVSRRIKGGACGLLDGGIIYSLSDDGRRKDSTSCSLFSSGAGFLSLNSFPALPIKRFLSAFPTSFPLLTCASISEILVPSRRSCCLSSDDLRGVVGGYSTTNSLLRIKRRVAAVVCGEVGGKSAHINIEESSGMKCRRGTKVQYIHGRCPRMCWKWV